MNFIEIWAIRASCYFCVILSLMVVYVMADVWRIERRTGRPLSAIAVGMLGAAALAVGIYFGHCAIVGLPAAVVVPANAPAPCR